MTWPMHDAGPTTPEPGSREPGPPEPGPDERELAGRGRHAGDTDPLPPLEGPMPGGPSPAETTLPLALGWPAPPARPARVPRFTPFDQSDSVDAPPGWRRVPRPGDHRPPGDPSPRPDDLRPRYPQPGYRPPPGAPGGPAGPGPPGGPPGGPARGPRSSRTAGQRALPRTSLVRSGAGMAVGTLASRGTGFLRTLVLVYATGVVGLGNAYTNANTLPNAIYYLMLGGIFTSVVVPLLVRAARRDPDHGEAYAQRMFTLGAVALLVVTVLATLLAGPAGRSLRAHHPRAARERARRRAPPDGAVGLLLHPADLLLRHELADRGAAEHPRPVRGADVDAGHQQPGRDRGRRVLHRDGGPGQGPAGHLRVRGPAARHRDHAGRRRADRSPVPVAARSRIPLAARARVQAG